MAELRIWSTNFQKSKDSVFPLQALTIDSYEKFAEGRQVSFIKDTSLANLFTSSLPPHYTLSDSCGVVLAFLVQEMVSEKCV